MNASLLRSVIACLNKSYNILTNRIMQGKIINGYTLQQPIGTGGMAEVWYAENKIGKKAAVKILLPKLCADDNVKSRFYTEAKVMVELNHPNIRQVLDFGDIDGRPAIVMEYLNGMDLKSKLKRGQRFTDGELKRWWNQMVDALNYTHKKGIIHRDIKPGNIFVDDVGDIKLLDFGIAKVRDSISKTQTGQKLGTLMYMSPEQVKDSRHIDYKTDIYSLAVTFVHLITGKMPYDSDTSSDFEISEQIVYKPLDLSGVPNAWKEFLTPYLEKAPEKRPTLRPIAIKDDDETVVWPDNADPIGVSPVLPDEKPKPNKAWIWILVALVILLGGGLAYKMIEERKEKGARVARLTELYNEKVKTCDMLIGNIVRDRDGNEGNKHFFIQALKTLQEIEKMEQAPNFNESGITPVYRQKFALFKANLSEAEELVYKKYERQVEQGTEDNTYCKELKERLDLMEDILQQSEKGSAVSIVPKSSRELR